MMLVAAGMAMAFKLRGEPRCALTWFGDGSTSRGDFHEAMNWAGVQKLPVVFVLENKPVRVLDAAGQAVRGRPGATRPGLRFLRASASTATTSRRCSRRTRAARERAVTGGGPTLIEAVTMRMHGHAAHDDMKYVPKEQVEEWKQRDPIDRQEHRLQALGVDVEALKATVAQELDAAVQQALQGPMPSPEDVLDGVFCDGEAEPLGDGHAPWSGFAKGDA